ncbi:MAG: formate--tetrahydrofolate ligase [Dehalococcoidia bacterium]
MRPIEDVAADLHLTPADLELYGPYKAKLTPAAMLRLRDASQGRLVLVTGITPTTAGEGKTTTSIGLTQALRRQDVAATVALREPSIGPVMGIKGGGTGGGGSEVLPADEINLHFTGDLHAVTTANNLLAATIDNSMFHGNPHALDARRISWRRCLDMNDRALRQMVIGMGGTSDGIPREERFDITPASEVMAILSVAGDLDDLNRRLGDVIVGYTRDIQPVFCRDLGVNVAMTVLLKQAMQPNLVQTSEGGPAFVHGGPFANIALGCNSIVATRAALATSAVVVTEAGFGSDLGAEKFFNIASRIGGLRPQVAVIVATARAIKRHGGMDAKELETENVAALRKGLSNLDAHIDNVQRHGVSPVVALNRFPADTDAEIAVIVGHCQERGVRVAEADPFGAGGAGCLALADAVRAALDAGPATLRYLYDLEQPLKEKIETVAREVYGAGSVVYLRQAELTLRRMKRLAMEELPVCIAKTQYSLAADASLLGRPRGFEFQVREVRPSAGAGFLVVIAGEIMTMPGLPKEPAATRFRLGGE